MKVHQVMFRIATMCRVLDVSSSGYYAWLTRDPSRRAQRDDELLRLIREIHAESDGTYGAPRIHADLVAKGIDVGRKRVARLMRGAGLVGVSRRKFVRTTERDSGAEAAPDLVERDFTAKAPDELWVATPISRSTNGFCHGDWGAISTSFMPRPVTRFRNAIP
jgi:putative transposase